MSKIDELIAKLCPNGVEYHALQDVFDIKNGYTPSKANPTFWTNGTIPWFRMEDIRKNGRVLNESIQKITPEAVKGGRLFPANSLIIATTATIGEHALLTADSLANQRFTFLVRKVNCLDLLDPRFVFYYGFVLGEWCRNNTNVSSFASVDMAKFKQFKIPIPPVEIQREIVDILDKFTQLEAELEAELEARKKQYEHYRNQLLTFDETGGVQWKTMAEIAHFKNGKGHEKSIVEDGQYIVVNSKFISTSGNVKKYANDQIAPVYAGDVLMVMSDLPKGKALARTFYIDQDDKYTLNQRICSLTVRDSNELSDRYLFYIANRNHQLLRYDSGVDQTNLRKDDILNITIPIPSLSEQNRIVSILDKFDKLTTDISEGLPAEINARRKQYEHYRSKLLTFKELAHV